MAPTSKVMIKLWKYVSVRFGAKSYSYYCHKHLFADGKARSISKEIEMISLFHNRGSYWTYNTLRRRMCSLRFVTIQRGKTAERDLGQLSDLFYEFFTNLQNLLRKKQRMAIERPDYIAERLGRSCLFFTIFL